MTSITVAEWYGAGSNHSRVRPRVVGIPPAAAVQCAPTPIQRAIPSASVNEYQRKLRSKRAYHAMH